MKTFVALGLLVCGSAASAQFIVTGPNVAAGTVSSGPASFPGTAPQAPDFGLADTSITPTMQRQRRERALLVAKTYPDLGRELARHSPTRARYIYAQAEKNAIWAAIDKSNR